MFEIQNFHMAFSKYTKWRNSTILFIIPLILALFLTSDLFSGNLLNSPFNESSKKDYFSQIPKKSDMYYENTTGLAMGIFVGGNYAYIADGESGLAIIDISDPINPGTPVYENTTGNTFEVYVKENYAYLADSHGLAIINVSDPTDPGSPIYMDTFGNAVDICVSGDYAYLALWNCGLAIIDISDPTNPGTPVYENTTGNASGVYVSGDYAYNADTDSGLAIIDISDPINPGEPIYRNVNVIAYDVFISGNYSYVTQFGNGLAIIDISDPTSPGTPVYRNTTGLALNIFVCEGYAFLADNVSGIAIIDVSNSEFPGTPVYKDTLGEANAVWVSGDYIYVADYNYGLAVIPYPDRVDPIITDIPKNIIVEYNYTGQNISWTATDLNPNRYTIEKFENEIVVEPTEWESSLAVNYQIPDGLRDGVHVYTINFMDDNGNFKIDFVSFTVKKPERNIASASFELFLIVSISTIAIIIILRKKSFCSNLE